MLIWLEDAPVYGCEDVTSFIDKIITYEGPSGQELGLLVNKQIHRHCQTCCKKSKNAECRFNFPQPLMKSTSILYPLGNDMSQNEIGKRKDMWKGVSKHLNDMKEGEEITFD